MALEDKHPRNIFVIHYQKPDLEIKLVSRHELNSLSQEGQYIDRYHDSMNTPGIKLSSFYAVLQLEFVELKPCPNDKLSPKRFQTHM